MSMMEEAIGADGVLNGDVKQAVRRVTLWGMAVNVLLTAVKFAVGLAVGSQSCVADAVHSAVPDSSK